MDEQHILDGALEIRAVGSARILSGSFPLGRLATIRNTGRRRKERFAKGRGGRSMSWQVREFEKLQEELSQVISSSVDEGMKAVRIEALEDAIEKRNTHLLIGHSYDRAIADMKTGNLALNFSDDAVSFQATLADEADMPSWVRDAVLAVRGGQLRGVSPGFQVTAKGGERLIPEPGNPSVSIREIEDATVFEYSLVSRPAYSGTTTDIRQDAVHGAGAPIPSRRMLLAITLTIAALLAAVRMGDSAEETAEATRLLAYATTAIEKHLGAVVYASTPPEVVNESAVRLCAYLYDMPNASRGAAYAAAMQNSGASAMLLPYRVHRAGSV